MTSPQPTCGAKAQTMEWTQPTSSAKAERKVVSVVWYLVSRRKWKLIGQKCILTYAGAAGLGLSYKSLIKVKCERVCCCCGNRLPITAHMFAAFITESDREEW